MNRYTRQGWSSEAKKQHRTRELTEQEQAYRLRLATEPTN